MDMILFVLYQCTIQASWLICGVWFLPPAQDVLSLGPRQDLGLP